MSIPKEYKKDPWFWVCVENAMKLPEFIDNWARLRGVEIPKPPYEGEAAKLRDLFLEDVYELIYTRVPHPLARKPGETKH